MGDDELTPTYLSLCSHGPGDDLHEPLHAPAGTEGTGCRDGVMGCEADQDKGGWMGWGGCASVQYRCIIAPEKIQIIASLREIDWSFLVTMLCVWAKRAPSDRPLAFGRGNLFHPAGRSESLCFWASVPRAVISYFGLVICLPWQLWRLEPAANRHMAMTSLPMPGGTGCT